MHLARKRHAVSHVPALPPITKGLAVGASASACTRVRLLAGDSASKGRCGEQFGSPQADGDPSSIPSRVRLTASMVSGQGRSATSQGRLPAARARLLGQASGWEKKTGAIPSTINRTRTPPPTHATISPADEDISLVDRTDTALHRLLLVITRTVHFTGASATTHDTHTRTTAPWPRTRTADSAPRAPSPSP